MMMNDDDDEEGGGDGGGFMASRTVEQRCEGVEEEEGARTGHKTRVSGRCCDDKGHLCHR